MTPEDIYDEAQAYYDGYEQDLGVHLELDLSYVWSVIEQYLSTGIEPEEVLIAVRELITGAADAAREAQDG